MNTEQTAGIKRYMQAIIKSNWVNYHTPDRSDTIITSEPGCNGHKPRMDNAQTSLSVCSPVTELGGSVKKRQDDGTTGQLMGHLATRGAASRYMARRNFTDWSAIRVITHFLSVVDCFNDNNSALVQFTLPAVDSLIRSGWTFADQKLTWLFFVQNMSHHLCRRLNNATGQCPVLWICRPLGILWRPGLMNGYYDWISISVKWCLII